MSTTSMQTPLPERRYGALQYVVSVLSITTGSYLASCGGISIPLLERETSIQVMHEDNLPLMLCHLNLGLCSRGVEGKELEAHLSWAEGCPIDWLPSKVKECGHIVGILVDNSYAGLNNLVAYAQEREIQIRL